MKQRLDRLLVEQKLAPSREKAQALIMAGKVRVDGQPAGKSGLVIGSDSHLEVLRNDKIFVSRGGEKLQAAFEYFNINPSGLVALDIGSSTGGFSHCLILGGAEKVFAVDVGYGQLAWAGAQVTGFFPAPPPLHGCNSFLWFKCAQQHEPVTRVSLHKNVGQPIHAVIEVYIGTASVVFGNEFTR